VFRCVQAQLDTLKGREEHEHWAYVLGLLGSGVHPKPEDIVKSIDLFRGDPYHLSYLYPGHVVKHSICLICIYNIYIALLSTQIMERNTYNIYIALLSTQIMERNT
jgi:hypothetical protein